MSDMTPIKTDDDGTVWVAIRNVDFASGYKAGCEASQAALLGLLRLARNNLHAQMFGEKTQTMKTCGLQCLKRLDEALAQEQTDDRP